MKFRTVFAPLCLLPALILGVTSLPSMAEIEVAVSGDGERMVAKQVTAQITAIDRKTRDITLEGPLGNTITLAAGEVVKRFDEFAVGDLVQATYYESISGELRTPTEAELETPWVELDGAALADADMLPAAGAGRIVRAVCTIEGLNRATGAVTVQDPRGLYHVIPDVDPANIERMNIGDSIIITYSQAIALSLEKTPAK
tara:strand:- start:30554 stop:31153 length:600 start_codon:yes stop_codon:yes gene_type:complete